MLSNSMHRPASTRNDCLRLLRITSGTELHSMEYCQVVPERLLAVAVSATLSHSLFVMSGIGEPESIERRISHLFTSDSNPVIHLDLGKSLLNITEAKPNFFNIVE